jgi:tetratricopeptide (TPR) repeat protein
VLNVDVKTAGADVQTSLEKRVAGHPDDLVALLRLAAIYQWHGDGKKAAETYEAALAVDPQSLQAMINLARLYAGDNPQKAFELAKNAYKLAPEDPIVSLTLGGLAYQTGDDKWAYTLLLPASENNTAGPDTLYQFGMAAYDLGKISDAVSAMQAALQSGTNFANAGNARRFLDLQTLATDPAKAVADESQIAEILKSNPDYVPALILEGLVNEQKSNPGAAEQLYEKVLDQHPDFAPAQRRLAILYSEDPSKDKQTYDLAVKARQAYPDDPNVARALGIVTYRMASAADDYSRAADLLAESARSQPQDAGLLYYLGMAQYHLKQQAECKSNLNRALALHLSGQSADEARRILKGLK